MRKVISSKKSEILKPVEQAEVKDVVETADDSADKIAAPVARRAKCFFCQSKGMPTYTDVVALRKFLTDRGKITPKQKNGLCAKHQRAVTSEIKRARHLALLPFTPKI